MGLINIRNARHFTRTPFVCVCGRKPLIRWRSEVAEMREIRGSWLNEITLKIFKSHPTSNS